ncbi:MAG: hypothetical protein JNL21_04540 [Myxococcales bacterium]|nr:hypothetical protein [Myxococcales bacterium]
MRIQAVASIAILSAVTLSGFAACEDTLVVVTPLGGGGQGGGGGNVGVGGAGGAPATTSSVTTATMMNAGGGCNGQMPVGELTFCGGSGVTATGGANECFFCVEDETGAQWQTDCVGDDCSCSLGGQVLCGCQQPGGGCGSLGCCPAPWNQPF